MTTKSDSPAADPVDDYHARTDHEAVSRVWEALGVTEYTGKHIAEHVSALIAERDALREALESVTRELDEVLCVTQRAIGQCSDNFQSRIAPSAKAIGEARARLTPKPE